MISAAELTQIPLLASLEPATQEKLSQHVFKLKRREGEILVFEGKPADYGYFLISGHVRVVRMNAGGRVQVLARLMPGSPLNFISLLVKERINRATIETLTPVSVLVIDALAVDKLLAECADFSNLLLRLFAERMKKITELAAGLSLYSVQARLAQFLIELAQMPDFTDSWTQDEIAAHIGTVRDVVGRLLREFEAQGLIKRSREQILLLDRKTLELIASGNETVLSS